MYQADKSLLLQLRDAAKVERDELTRFNMRTVADDLSVAIRAFQTTPTGTNLTTLQGLWVRGIRVLSFANPIDPSTSGGAKMRLQEAA
jgi:hypothetical protein